MNANELRNEMIKIAELVIDGINKQLDDYEILQDRHSIFGYCLNVLSGDNYFEDVDIDFERFKRIFEKRFEDIDEAFITFEIDVFYKDFVKSKELFEEEYKLPNFYLEEIIEDVFNRMKEINIDNFYLVAADFIRTHLTFKFIINDEYKKGEDDEDKNIYSVEIIFADSYEITNLFWQ